MDIEKQDSLQAEIKANPQAALERRTSLKIVFIRKILLIAFLQSITLEIIYLILLIENITINYHIAIPIVFLVVLALFSLIAFSCFKCIRKTPQNIFALFAFTISELLVILYGLGNHSSRIEISYIILLTFGSISAVYLVFLIYTLFISKRFITWIPIVCIVIILAILFTLMMVYYPNYIISISVDCACVFLFTLYLTIRVGYINYKFGNGYSGQAYIVLAAKMITDAFVPIVIVVVAVLAVAAFCAALFGGGGDSGGCDCKKTDCCVKNCDCESMNCNCCCFCLLVLQGKDQRPDEGDDKEDDLEKFDRVAQSEFEGAPLPNQNGASHN